VVFRFPGKGEALRYPKSICFNCKKNDFLRQGIIKIPEFAKAIVGNKIWFKRINKK
jgi:hypothetical protein